MTDPITDRIPKPKNVGKHHESTVYSLWNNLKTTREIASSPEPSLYIPSERHACGYPLPNFQRAHKWSQEMSIKFIESIWLQLNIGTYMFHEADWESNGKPKPFSGWLIDGQQRLSAIEAYWNDEFRVFGLLWSELKPNEVRRFHSTKFPCVEISVYDEQEIRELYNMLNFGGIKHEESERA